MDLKKKNLIFGRNPVKEAIKANKVLKIYITKVNSDVFLNDCIAKNKINFEIVTNDYLDSLSNHFAHQGVAAEIKPYEYVSLEYILKKAKSSPRPIIVILDEINDPQNFGAILRNCDVFGVDGVLVSKHNQVSLNATVAKTSAGAINYVPVGLVTNINQTIKTLKENGYWVVASDGSAKQSYLDLKYDFPVALIIGSEGFGISPLILKNSDFVIKIPMYGKVNSLNASVAAGILLAKIKN